MSRHQHLDAAGARCLRTECWAGREGLAVLRCMRGKQGVGGLSHDVRDALTTLCRGVSLSSGPLAAPRSSSGPILWGHARSAIFDGVLRRARRVKRSYACELCGSDVARMQNRFFLPPCRCPTPWLDLERLATPKLGLLICLCEAPLGVV